MRYKLITFLCRWVAATGIGVALGSGLVLAESTLQSYWVQPVKMECALEEKDAGILNYRLMLYPTEEMAAAWCSDGYTVFEARGSLPRQYACPRFFLANPKEAPGS